jgi:hypothetical protein
MAPLARHLVRLRVQGELPVAWSTILGDLWVVAEPNGTTLVSGELADQAAVHGLLAAIRDLGLSLISVETVAIAIPPDRTGSQGSAGPPRADVP